MKKINEWFKCVWCQFEVPLADKTCRNHCSQCFLSLHVDGELPGDRNTSCHGQMIPIEYEIRNGETKIHSQCVICKKEHWNKIADDDNLWELDHKITFWRSKYSDLL